MKIPKIYKRCTITGHIPSDFPYYLPEFDIAEDDIIEPLEDYDEDDESYLECKMEEYPDCLALKKRLRLEIIALIEGGVTDFFCGTQQGVEMWATEIIIKLHQDYPDISITLIGVNENETDNWNANARHRAFDLIYPHSAVKFTYTASGFHGGNLSERNRLLVQRGDVVLAVWNGAELTEVGAFLRLAKKEHKKVILIDV